MSAAHFTPAQYKILADLRERFLTGTAGAADYWRSEEELALYDATFGARIGWKWSSVLAELHTRGWSPPAGPLVDWGCGAGIASRQVLHRWPQHFTELTLHDRSPRAMAYTQRAVLRALPSLPVQTAPALTALLPGATLVVSHVMSELSPAQLQPLVALAQQAAALLWVEAGTHAESRRLVAEVREPLLATGHFQAIAPCTHSATCGLLAPENTRHWCHSFGSVPAEAFQSAQWSELSRTLGIDLRSLPYSFLVLARTPSPTPPGQARVIGHPREYKGYLKALSCEARGVAELMLQKRDAPDLWRTVRHEPAPPIYHWQREGTRIRSGRHFQDTPHSSST